RINSALRTWFTRMGVQESTRAAGFPELAAPTSAGKLPPWLSGTRRHFGAVGGRAPLGLRLRRQVEERRLVRVSKPADVDWVIRSATRPRDDAARPTAATSSAADGGHGAVGLQEARVVDPVAGKFGGHGRDPAVGELVVRGAAAQGRSEV